MQGHFKFRLTLCSEDDIRWDSRISQTVVGPNLNHVIGVGIQIPKLITYIPWMWNFGSASYIQYLTVVVGVGDLLSLVVPEHIPYSPPTAWCGRSMRTLTSGEARAYIAAHARWCWLRPRIRTTDAVMGETACSYELDREHRDLKEINGFSIIFREIPR